VNATNEHGQWDDQRVEIIIGVMLRVGVLLAAAVVLAGAVCYLAGYGHSPSDYRAFHGEPADLRSVPQIIHHAFSLRCRGIIQLGLLLLILTPIARVAFSVVAFWLEKDRMYVIMTLVVLANLIYSLFGT
jgi:uncharacterized membrane protein